MHGFDLSSARMFQQCHHIPQGPPRVAIQPTRVRKANRELRNTLEYIGIIGSQTNKTKRKGQKIRTG